MIITPASAATATWSSEQVLESSIDGATNIHTAISEAGTSVVVWDKLVGVDPQHPYGIYQVSASVHTSNGGWSVNTPLTGPDATNAGAVVDPFGTVTVFWTSGGVSYDASSIDGGKNWSSPEIIDDSGYTLVSGVNAQVGPSVGADKDGNIIVVMTKPRSTSPVSYDAKALVKPLNGTWSTEALLTGTGGIGIFGSIRLYVNSDGQALFNSGFSTFRRDPQTQVKWGTEQTVSVAGLGQIYSASAGLDAGGNGYFVFRTRYSGAFLSTSTPVTGWTKPRHVAKFDILGSSLQVTGSSPGYALVYGNDMNTGAVRATVTADTGATWGALTNFGFGDSPFAAGSENGLYSIGWSSGGTNWDRYTVASGTGIGTGTAAWVKKALAGNFAGGSVAVAGSIAGGSAQSVAGWGRMATAIGGGTDIGAATGTVAP